MATAGDRSCSAWTVPRSPRRCWRSTWTAARCWRAGQAPHTVSTGAGRETDPEVWWRALQDALGSRGARARQAAAVSVGGQQHGLVVLDGPGEPLRPALLWNDVRSAPQAEALVAEQGGAGWAERFGSVPGASFTVAKWEWLRANEPAGGRRHGRCGCRTTSSPSGSAAPPSPTAVTPPAPAGGRRDRVVRRGAARRRSGLDPKLLPAVLGSGRGGGDGTGPGRRPAGALVGAGTGDNAAAALGLGPPPGRRR